MIIVAGHITVGPGRRAPYLSDCACVVEQARRATGCLDFAVSADLIDPSRINIFELWASQSDLDAFRGDGPSNAQVEAILSAAVAEYTIGSAPESR